jgi:hypothetical protein
MRSILPIVQLAQLVLRLQSRRGQKQRRIFSMSS